MRRSILAVTALSLMLVSASIASAGSSIDSILKKKELLIGTSGDVPPLTFKTKDGKFEGLDIDLGRLLARAIGLNFKAVGMPFDELIPALEKGQIDMIISSMTITPKRNLRIAYAGPYFMSGQSLLTTKDTAGSIKGPENISLPDFSIAVSSGTTSEAFVKNQFPKARRVVVKSTDEALNLLLQQKVTGVIADYPFCTVGALRYRDRGFVCNPPFTLESIGIAVRADDPLLVNLLQNFLSMLQVSGQLQGMTKRWFEDPAWLKDLPEEQRFL